MWLIGTRKIRAWLHNLMAILPKKLILTETVVFFSNLVDVGIFLCSHALIHLAPSNHTSGFSNEISFVFEFQADLGIYKNKLKVEGPDPYVKFTLRNEFEFPAKTIFTSISLGIGITATSYL